MHFFEISVFIFIQLSTYNQVCHNVKANLHLLQDLHKVFYYHMFLYCHVKTSKHLKETKSSWYIWLSISITVYINVKVCKIVTIFRSTVLKKMLMNIIIVTPLASSVARVLPHTKQHGYHLNPMTDVVFS